MVLTEKEQIHKPEEKDIPEETEEAKSYDPEE
jgi:hypothetical protein